MVARRGRQKEEKEGNGEGHRPDWSGFLSSPVDHLFPPFLFFLILFFINIFSSAPCLDCAMDFT
jgi:hypothetical protein